MKICLVNLDFTPFRSSGLAVYGETLAQGLAKRGHEVTIIASRRPGTLRRETVGGIEVWRVPIGWTNWIGFAYRAARLLEGPEKRTHFDIVHFLDVHFACAYQGPYIASLFQSFRQRLAGAGNLPYHSSPANLVGRYIYYNLARIFMERHSLREARYLIAGSKATKDEFVNHYGVEEAKIEVVWLGIDTTFFRQRKVAELRERLGLKDRKTLLYVGFSTPRKGLEYLAKALARVSEDAKLLMVGRWERRYRKKFLQAIGDNAARVLEVGYVPDEEMPFYYSLADVFVLPSLLEGFGLPLVEAMACGTPIVATNVGSIPEVVGDCGLLVPPRDPKALAKAIEKVLGDKRLRRQLAAAGRERAERFFSQDGMIESTLNLYTRLRF